MLGGFLTFSIAGILHPRNGMLPLLRPILIALAAALVPRVVRPRLLGGAAVDVAAGTKAPGVRSPA